MGPLTRYLEAAMARAQYDLKAKGRYLGEIPELGLRVEGESLEGTRLALREALEVWLLKALRQGLQPPGLEVPGESPLEVRFRGLVGELWNLIQGGAKEAPEAAPSDRPKEAGLLEWLKARGLTPKEGDPAPQTPEEASALAEREKVLTRLALFLGDRYSTLEKLYERLKQSLSQKRQFELSLSEASPEEIANTTQFCTLLKQYALLTSYRYKSEDRLLQAKANPEGWVQNFLTGGWLERYVAEKARRVLRSKNLPHEVGMGYQVTLPNGEAMELDLLVGVGERVYWLEAKTGDFQAHIPKYVALRKALGLAPKEAFLVVLGLDPSRAKELSALHGLTVVGHGDFQQAFQETLEAHAL